MRLQLVPLCHWECRVVSWFPNRIIIFYFFTHKKTWILNLMQSSSKLLGKWKFMFKLCKGVNQHANKNGNKSWKFFTFTLHPANVSTVDRSWEMLRSFKCNRRRRWRRWWADVFEECLEMLRRCSSIIEWEGKINFQHFRWMSFTLEMFTFGSIVDIVGEFASLFFSST